MATDVELLKSLNPFLTDTGIIGFENDSFVNSGQMLAAEAGHFILAEMMEREDGDIFEVADPRSEFEQTVIYEMQIAAFAEQNITDKDREILKLRMDGHTEQEIADKVGYKTASAVHKRIAKIASAYEDFVTAEYGKYLDK